MHVAQLVSDLWTYDPHHGPLDSQPFVLKAFRLMTCIKYYILDLFGTSGLLKHVAITYLDQSFIIFTFIYVYY